MVEVFWNDNVVEVFRIGLRLQEQDSSAKPRE
jgi:hypothetical protein